MQEEDVRCEYTALTTYGNQLVTLRFTIVGLYGAASGVFIGAILKDGINWNNSLWVSPMALLFAICVWIFELRNRALIGNLARRGVYIEHEYWGLTGPDWYEGFLSRQMKGPRDVFGPRPPGPDRPTLGLARKQLPVFISKHISHSLAFDLFYGTTLLFWAIVLVFSVVAKVHGWGEIHNSVPMISPQSC